jgi:hypothetical protein
MRYVFFALLLLNNITAQAMEFHSFSNMQEFLDYIAADKENRDNSLLSDNFVCALEIYDLESLGQFIMLDYRLLSTIQKITISVNNATSLDVNMFIVKSSLCLCPAV